MMVEIRLATEDDIDAIKEFHINNHLEETCHFPGEREHQVGDSLCDFPQLYSKEVFSKGNFWVASPSASDHDIIGCIGMLPDKDESNVSWLNTLSVTEEMRGKQIGSKLMKVALDTVKPSNIVRLVTLGGHSEGKDVMGGARYLYEKNGFKVYKVEKVKYGDETTIDMMYYQRNRDDECKKPPDDIDIHEENLFRIPPPNEDCPICMLPIPSLWTGSKYYDCCGKIICSGCIFAVTIRDIKEQKCPFCRAPNSDAEETMTRTQKRMDMGDSHAFYNMGCCYDEGVHGLPVDLDRALTFWHQAGELGHANSYYNIGSCYHLGEGVERDNEKAHHYFELGAIGGSVEARFRLGLYEYKPAGNVDQALKHFMIAVTFGHSDSLQRIRLMFMNGHATKDEYANALRAYQAYMVDIKSDQRNEAASFSDIYRYY